MIVRRYQIKDFAQIKAWGAEWGAQYDESQFPSTGFIIDGIAAYFLYSTDSSCCWLENMICKKGTDKFIKSRALDLLVDAILKEAKTLGYVVAYATTDIPSVLKRAKSNGALLKPLQFLVTKDLTNKIQ